MKNFAGHFQGLLLAFSSAKNTQTLAALKGTSNNLRRGLNPIPEVGIAGNNGLPETAFPLQNCQGDCDSDYECSYGLVCLQRSDEEPVPGCAGTPNSGSDYCIQPSEETQLVLQGNNGIPEAVFFAGLGLCEGDCDMDSDCQTGLKCFKRDGYTSVPGCLGDGASGSDYCILPPTLAYVGNNDELEPNQLGECEGDCDDDDDCRYGFVCHQRSTDETYVPGCEGTVTGSTDYCIKPEEGQLVLRGNNGFPVEAFSPGLGMCEGDCDSDGDCEGALKCFQRSGHTIVPGCSGPGASNSDYCYLPGTINYVENSSTADHQLGLCEGDCDSDEWCQHGLVCFQKSSSDSGQVPGCEGIDTSSTDYCTYPFMENQLVVVGNNDIEKHGLGLCEGDCDDDNDCALGLICDLRHDDESVNGCAGDGIDEYDYCIEPPAGWLVKVGDNNFPASRFPLQECQGDCDSDSECAGDLVCRQRSSWETVPGCEGWGGDGVDYCGPVPAAGSKRIIAIGDVHGDVYAARNALKLAGVLDDNDVWIGGETTVVQCGDQTDRGDTEREVLDLFEDLRVQARAAGGDFHPLIGNHEVMNVKLNFYSVTDGGFAEFADVPYDENDSLVMSYPPEQRGRVAAFRPGGPYAKMIADHQVILMLEGSLFVHGGVLPTHVTYGINQINSEIKEWMKGDAPQPDTSEIEDEDHPIWSRHYSDEPGDADCALLEEVLEATGMDRMVVGHTIQWDDGIHSDCGGKIWKVDVGLSTYYDYKQLVDPQILEIQGDVVTVIRG